MELRVVIVDDQPLFRAVARLLVGQLAGWRVVAEAGSAEEALAVLPRLRADLVLLDVHLPGMDGIEAAARIKALPDAPAVVLVSTYAAEDLPPEVRDCGAVAYVHKDDLTPSLLRGLVSDSGISPRTVVP